MAFVYKECGQAPLSTSSPGSSNHFHGIYQFAPVRHGVTSQELFKIVGILSSISLLEIHKLLVNRLLKPAQEKVWLSELTVPQ